MRKALYSLLVLALAVTAGFVVAKRKYVANETKTEAEIALEQERLRIVSVAKNAYGLGCLQSFDRVCSLLKKDEAKRCVTYSDSYCKDASIDYTIKLKAILQGNL